MAEATYSETYTIGGRNYKKNITVRGDSLDRCRDEIEKRLCAKIEQSSGANSPERETHPDVADMLEKLESAQARLLKLEARMSDISFDAANCTDNSITLARCLAAQDDIKNAKGLLADVINGINRNSAASDGEEDGE